MFTRVRTRKNAAVIMPLKIIIFVVSFLIMLQCAPSFSAATTISKKSESHAIAIVFDNSGSMYENMSWSRAKYATETFASMLDYENGDVLNVYPMHPVSNGKSGKASKNPINVKSMSNIPKIHNMYTHNALGTPFSTVTTAYKSLQSSKADSKWLIVLTDGGFDGYSVNKTANALIKNSSNVNVQYVGIGSDAADLSSYQKGHFSAVKVADSSGLTKRLSEICNRIFKRNEVSVSNNKIELDVSVKKLIVFAQGKGAKIDSIENSEGTKVDELNDTRYSIKTNKLNATNFTSAPADTSLGGVIVSFDACKAGTYKINGSGTMQVFYEPDVDIGFTLTDSEGNKVDTSQSVTVGDYSLTASVIDVQTGEDVTNSKLLNNSVRFGKINVTSPNGDTVEIDNGGTINISEAGDYKIGTSATYLDGYTVTTDDNKNGAFSINAEFPAVNELAVKLDVLQNNKYYKLADHKDWKPVRASFTYGGNPLTDEQLANLDLSVAFSPEIDYTIKPVEGESAYDIYVAHKDGEYIEPQCGKYNLKAEATFVDEYGQSTGCKDDAGFEIQVYDIFWRWLKWLIIFLIILLLILFILTRKAWPHKMALVLDDGHRYPIRVGKQITILPIFSAVSAKASKSSILLQKFSKRAKIHITDVRPRSNVESFKINYVSYTKANGYIANGEPFSGVIRNNTPIEVYFNDGKPSKKGTIIINK